MDKKEFKQMMKECREHLGQQLYEIRRKQGLTAEEVYMETNLFTRHIEKMEMGLVINLDFLVILAKFYNKKIKIELID